jgi:hypothetical protein
MKLTNKFENIPGVYVITNLINGKVYVGESLKIHKRISEHKSRKDRLISKAFKKYGIENFTIYIEYMPNFSKNDLWDLEEQLILKFDSLSPKGYNICSRGDGPVGLKHSPESKLKMSESQKLIAKYGSENPLSKPVYVYGINGKFIKHFIGYTQAGRELGLSHSTIIGVLDGTHLQSKGYIFKKEYMGKEITPISNNEIESKSTKRKVARCDIEGNILEKFDSVWDAAVSTNTSRQAITGALRGLTKKSKFRLCKGFRWKYLN